MSAPAARPIFRSNDIRHVLRENLELRMPAAAAAVSRARYRRKSAADQGRLTINNAAAAIHPDGVLRRNGYRSHQGRRPATPFVMNERLPAAHDALRRDDAGAATRAHLPSNRAAKAAIVR